MIDREPEPEPNADPSDHFDVPAARGRRRMHPDGEGLENPIDRCARTILIVGGAVALVSGLAAASQGGSGWPLLEMVLQLLGVLAVFLLLRAVAEIIRLQKRIAGVRYTGTISGDCTREEVRCSGCGGELIDLQRCDHCRRPIEGIDDVDDEPAANG